MQTHRHKPSIYNWLASSFENHKGLIQEQRHAWKQKIQNSRWQCMYVTSLTPENQEPQTFLMSKNFNEPKDSLYFPCLEKFQQQSISMRMRNIYICWHNPAKSLHLPKVSWKIIFLGSLDMLATLQWHRAGLRVANYAAQQVMTLWREMDRQGKGES